jgi:hypothetical protein
MLLWNCGEAPPAPEEWTGTVVVTAVLPDDSLPDSIEITLDGALLGQFANPHTLSVVAGVHLLEVSAEVEVAEDSIITYSSAPQRVEVLDDQEIQLAVQLTTDIEAPYVGYKAPDFRLTDLAGDSVRLEDLSGKIALLYFFSFT